jgi:hypothetical protein
MEMVEKLSVGRVRLCDGERPIKRLVFTEPTHREIANFDRYEDAEKWVVVLQVPGNRIDEENAEIVTIDNTEGGEGHIDYQFLPDDSIPQGNKLVWFDGTLSLREAEILAERNAEHWTRIYRSNHELPKKK